MGEKRKKITVTVSTDMVTDQRVIRICTSLQEMGFDVLVIARKINGSKEVGSHPFKIKRLYCYFTNGPLQFIEFHVKLFLQLAFTKTTYFLANDLDTLLPVYLNAKLRGKKIFYDTHEYFTGVPDLANAPIKRKIWKSVEDFILPQLKTVYTVNQSVKNKYQEEYNIPIEIIRNVSITRQVSPVEKPKHWENKIILLMQGIGIHVGRGGMELLEMMRYLPENFHLVYIGTGSLWETMQQKSKEWNIENKVEFHPPKPPNDLAKYTPLADLGFSLDGFDNLNFLFNLPNKVFDYIHAGVPIVATPIPEVKAIIEQYHCGICLSSYKPPEMALEVQQLVENQALYQTLKANTKVAAKELCWENEQEKLKNIYRPFL